MSQCVPNWDLDDAVPSRFDVHPHPSTSGPDVPMIDYEMAELTWENGQLSMQGLGLRRVSSKPSICTSFPNTKCAWERPRAAPGTLESIVNLATQKTLPPHCSLPGGAAAVTMDTLVPCKAPDEAKTVPRVVGCSTRVDSCSGAAAATTCQLTTKAVEDGDEGSVLKKTSFVPHVPMTGQQSVSVSRSGTMGVDSWHVPTVDTCENELGGFGVTSTSFGSQGNTLSSSGLLGTNNTTTLDDHDSVCHSRPQRDNGNEEERKRNGKSSSSTRRSRAAAIHNQSERKRRDKINQKMKMLQKLVPNSNKTDKASMLDEVIDYLKQLQAQVHMMSRMHTIPPMMMPHQLAMQQQLQMSMMAAAAAASTPMGMGMGMAAMPGPMDMNMNINPMAARQNLAAAFMPVAAAAPSPDGQATALAVPTDPISTYLACQPQPMSVDAYSRMIAVIQQQQQQLASASKH